MTRSRSRVPPAPGRRQCLGPAEVAAALERRDSLRLVLVRRGTRDAHAAALAERARAAGVPVQATSHNDLRRMSCAAEPAEILGLVGPDPGSDADSTLAAAGAVWALVGIRYPGNAGFAIRTAEVSGAAGVFLDTVFDGSARRQALRASMYAQRFLPVHWGRAEAVLDAACRTGRRVLAVEDVGDAAPWEVDLTGPVLFLVGNEEEGLPAHLLAAADRTLRIPMAGFVPSYNLQAAMAMVAGERMRQERRGS